MHGKQLRVARGKDWVRARSLMAATGGGGQRRGEKSCFALLRVHACVHVSYVPAGLIYVCMYVVWLPCVVFVEKNSGFAISKSSEILLSLSQLL